MKYKIWMTWIMFVNTAAVEEKRQMLAGFLAMEGTKPIVDDGPFKMTYQDAAKE